MRKCLKMWMVLLAVLAGGSHGWGGELLPRETEMAAVVDHYIQVELKRGKLKAAPLADDANLLRRTTLDLAGRLPSAFEAQAYVQSTQANKRQELIERLLASDGYVRHQANELDLLLMTGTGYSLKNYLAPLVRENKPWDEIFRDMLLAESKEGKPHPASEFLKQRAQDLDQLTNEVSVRFFGVNISCAKCHDHPLVDDWKQDHFYGMKSFFSRTFRNGDFIAEREYGLIKFKTTAGEEKTAKLMFLTGTEQPEPADEEPSKEEQKKQNELFKELEKKKEAPPAPKFSRRAQLLEVALKTGENEMFAKSIVNRIWHRLIGYGLVMPLDQMHSGNPPTHPELLDWLARDLIEHQYDLRHLIRGIVQSDTYALSSRWEGDDRPEPYYFAVANARPLNPLPYGAALKQASASPDQFQPEKTKPEDLEKRLEGTANSGASLANLFETPDDYFQVGVDEALLLNNNERLTNDLLADNNTKLVGHLKQITDRRQWIDTLYWTILSRPPAAEEVAAVSAYLDARQDRPVEATQQVVWALLASAEFRFNY